MTSLELTESDHAMLGGDAGPAVALAMRLIVKMAGIGRARRLIDVTRAHIDGCLYHGRAGLDFVERLVDLEGVVRVPTTLNVGTLDLLHPELYHGDAPQLPPHLDLRSVSAPGSSRIR